MPARKRSQVPAPATADKPLPDRERLADLRAALLAWFDENARELPWRAQPGAPASDPYAVWVSEIMLQQTRVETVLRYYDRFMARFPDALALAAAEEDEVMAAWSGLGYYRRARLLHRGVREVVARYGGQVPEDAAARSELPGVGRYTAGAIGSIAFGRPEPIVDGNVMRVFARLFEIETPLGRRESETRMWALSEALVDGPRPGDFNQALMELGALVCTKGVPRCEACPVADACQARAAGKQAALPVPRAKKPPKPVSLVAVVVTGAARGGAGKVCLQRGGGQLFGALWNLPMSEGRGLDAARAALAGVGLDVTPEPEPVAELEHVLTHRRLQVQVHRASVARVPRGTDTRRFVGVGELAGLGISSLTRKVLRAVGVGDAG